MVLKNKKILILGILLVVAVLIICLVIVTNTIKKNNIMKNYESVKTNPAALMSFLLDLEEDKYFDEDIKNDVSIINFTVDDKILIHSAHLKYYTIPGVTKSDIEAYLQINGTLPLYMESGKGGFYDGKEDLYSNERIGLSNSPLYTLKSVKYFGDFYVFHQEGVELNEQYQEEFYSSDSFNFKGNKIDFDPRQYDCYYSGKYLFGIGSTEIYVHDTEAKTTYRFFNN